MDYDNLFVSIGSVIIDDIILPDGCSKMSILGGGAVHAAMGMRVWNKNVGLVSMIGENFPEEYRLQLNKYFDTSGLLKRLIPTPRAWMLFEEDGKRNEVFRTSYKEMINNFNQPVEFPQSYKHLLGVHLHCDPNDIPRWVEILRAKGTPILLWEPWDQFCHAENFEKFCQYARLVDIVSPNLTEGNQFTGLDDPKEITKIMLDKGAKVVALRMGAKGSFVACQDRYPVEIPAFEVDPIIDVTGAGNSYCGGFICGMHHTRDPINAGYYGSVSASFTLEQFGALHPLENITSQANERLHGLLHN
jgi:sugar/nucleoside kinase (ribokinase family)